MKDTFYHSKVRKVSKGVVQCYLHYMRKKVNEGKCLDIVQRMDYNFVFFQQLTARLLGCDMINMMKLPSDSKVGSVTSNFRFSEDLVNECLEEYRQECKKCRWFKFATSSKNRKMVLASSIIFFSVLVDAKDTSTNSLSTSKDVDMEVQNEA